MFDTMDLTLKFGLGFEITRRFAYGNTGDNMEWSRPSGISKFAREKKENLQSRVEEENTITNVENAVFDLSIVYPLGFLFIRFKEFLKHQKMGMLESPRWLCALARSVDDMPSRTQAYMEYTRWVFCKLCGRPIKHHLIYPTRRHDFLPRFFQEYALNHDLTPQLAHLFVGDMRWRDDELLHT
ncbi:hypothetical protein Tco_0281929 [Tanacetum coccineum]